jgi:CDP-paratose 2-epimerase
MGYHVIGIDNDMRDYFFGASTKNIGSKLISKYENFTHHNIDIRHESSINSIFRKNEIELIVHAAAQPSHDWAAKEPLTDFNINATATLILLEAYRKYQPEASFVFTSTNKVYGDTPNYLEFQELETRYDTIDETDIDESMSVDNSKHSIFGASKVAADIMVQEYGRYFGLNTVCFRCGCLTGEEHQGAELHGFLSYLVKCIIMDKDYTVYGYKGKQVRDNIHAEDLVAAFVEYHKRPKSAAVYNMGGGRSNSVSILEAINKINKIANKTWSRYKIEQMPRSGDHKWYISDLTKFTTDYPNWKINNTIDNTIQKMVNYYD